MTDVIRSRCIFTNATRFQRLANLLMLGFSTNLDGFALSLDLIRVKNKMKHVDPTHFRNILCNVLLRIVRPDGTTFRCFCEIQLHHMLILSFNNQSHAHTHYEFFRSKLEEDDLAKNMEFMVEARIRVFEEVCKTPVLLSMLILVLGASEESKDITLPSDLYHLYIMALNAALGRNFKGEEMVMASRMLRAIATANHMAQRRTFTLADARNVLKGSPGLQMWEELCGQGSIPLVKILAFGENSGEFQFKHLSCTSLPLSDSL